MFERVLIANRGEIACRVIRTCRRLGIHSIAVYSEADRDAQHVRQADEAWPIGGSAPADSYLRIDTILEVARKSAAQAIHPGYGFLSENTAFSRACEQAGIVFIGPRPESIDAMGSKAAAKELMSHHEVPLVPGYYGANQDADFLAQQARQMGYPLLLKPSAGGGGKGMQIVREDAEFAPALEAAQRVAKAAFGDASMLLERYIEHPRHIEFQIFGDSHGNVIHLNERECSSQRRFQKVLEETPSPFVTPELRAAMGQAAVNAARAVDYLGAGTVEFIVGPDGEFFFMEMNTRLQVEHPVTEMTLGLDLVEWQLRVAAGEELPRAQEDIVARGHAVEVRIYAEDPEHNFLPGSGRLDELRLPPPSAQVRIDSGVVAGDTVTIFYDPMIAKLIVWEADRNQALQRLHDALGQCRIVGPKSNIAFLERLVTHPVLVQAEIDSGYLDQHLEEFLDADKPSMPEVLAAAATALLLHQEDRARHRTDPADPYSPWARADAWRPGAPGTRAVTLTHGAEQIAIDARGHDGNYRLEWAGQTLAVAGARNDGDTLQARFDGTARRLPVQITGTHVTVHDAHGWRHQFESMPRHGWESGAEGAADHLIAPMPGRIVLVKAKPDDEVQAGQELVIIEAMKMELSLKAPRAGTIEEVRAHQGEFVDADTVLVRLATP